MSDDVLASMRAGAENLDKLRDDLPKAVARMRAAKCSEELVLQYPSLLERIVVLFEDLKGAIVRGDIKAAGAIGEQMQVEQAKLLPLVQSIWKSAKRPKSAKPKSAKPKNAKPKNAKPKNAKPKNAKPKNATD